MTRLRDVVDQFEAGDDISDDNRRVLADLLRRILRKTGGALPPAAARTERNKLIRQYANDWHGQLAGHSWLQAEEVLDDSMRYASDVWPRDRSRAASPHLAKSKNDKLFCIFKAYDANYFPETQRAIFEILKAGKSIR